MPLKGVATGQNGPAGLSQAGSGSRPDPHFSSADQFKEVGIREGLSHWSPTLAVSMLLALIGIVGTAWVLVRG